MLEIKGSVPMNQFGNQSPISIAHNLVQHDGTKHIERWLVNFG